MSLSLARTYQLGDDELRHSIIWALTPEKKIELAHGKPWWFYGRPEQWAPIGDWRWWLINAGRGWGKTRTGAEWIVDKARRYPGCRIALVAMTFTDGRDTMIEGVSGILNILHPAEFRDGNIERGWNRSLGEIFMANGSHMKLFSSERPRQLRGPAHHFTWGDEPAYWYDAALGTDRDTTWSNLNIGLREPRRKDWALPFRGQGILTTTPRRVPLLKVPDQLLKDQPSKAGLMQRADTIVTIGTSMDNVYNLEAAYRDAVITPLLGTTLGRQEIGGEMLEAVEGALWTEEMITLARDPQTSILPADLLKTVVGFDPAGGGGAGHDEHGIIVASSGGRAGDLHAYIRADYSRSMSVDEAARQVILAAFAYGADAIAYEKNQGQDWIPGTLRPVFESMREAGDIPDTWLLPTLEPQNAITNKFRRAQPVAALYAPLMRKVHHVDSLPVVEGQMTSWIPGESDSPDRMDALVWAVTWLMGTGPMRAAVASPAQRERGGRRAGMPSSQLPAVYGSRGNRR